MWAVLGEMDKVYKATGSLLDAWFCISANKGANEDLFELFMVASCPLFDS